MHTSSEIPCMTSMGSMTLPRDLLIFLPWASRIMACRNTLWKNIRLIMMWIRNVARATSVKIKSLSTFTYLHVLQYIIVHATISTTFFSKPHKHLPCTYAAYVKAEATRGLSQNVTHIFPTVTLTQVSNIFWSLGLKIVSWTSRLIVYLTCKVSYQTHNQCGRSLICKPVTFYVGKARAHRPTEWLQYIP